jgi:hypothetical protein
LIVQKREKELQEVSEQIQKREELLKMRTFDDQERRHELVLVSAKVDEAKTEIRNVQILLSQLNTQAALNRDQITMMQDLLEQLHLQNKQGLTNLDDLHN